MTGLIKSEKGLYFPEVSKLISNFEERIKKEKVDPRFFLNAIRQGFGKEQSKEVVQQVLTNLIDARKISPSLKGAARKEAKRLKRLKRLTLNLSIEKVEKNEGKLKKFTHALGTLLHIDKRLYFIPKGNKKVASETLAEIVKNNPAIPAKIRKRLGAKKIVQISEEDLKYAEEMSDRYAKAFRQALAQAEEERKEPKTEKQQEIYIEGRSPIPMSTKATPVEKIAIRILATSLLDHCSKMEKALEEKIQHKRDIAKKELSAEEKAKEKKYRKIREYIDHIAWIARSIEEEEDIKESGYITVGST